MNTPWAILLIHFKDSLDEPFPRSRYEEIFTSAGAGKWNMVDYFRDMSHGRLDLSGSKVFGWIELDKARADYKGSGPNPQGRRDLITWAREKASEKYPDLDLSKFFSVVVVLNYGHDLFGGPYGVVCGDDGANKVLSGLSPSLLGQEMGHAYGLRHSRLEGSPADYMDPYDIMSTVTRTFMAPHPVYTARDVRGDPVYRIGPGLNAANMAAVDWLDLSRVWVNLPGARIETTLELRPLHRPDLPGFLAARLGRYFIEFRVKELWDGSVDPCVLVHYFDDGHSYLVTDDAGRSAFTQGSVMSTPPNMSIFGSGQTIRVLSIDDVNRIAKIQVSMQVASLPNEVPSPGPFQTPWVKWAAIASGDQALVVLNGIPLTIPRSSFAHQLLENVVLHQSTLGLGTERLKAAVQREALSNLAHLVEERTRRREFGEPGLPPVPLQRVSREE
jgi:hypothetical protein